MARNAIALEELRSEESVELRKFPDDVLARLKVITFEVIEEMAAEDELVAKVWTSYRDFMERSQGWQEISEQAYLSTRNL